MINDLFQMNKHIVNLNAQETCLFAGYAGPAPGTEFALSQRGQAFIFGNPEKRGRIRRKPQIRKGVQRKYSI